MRKIVKTKTNSDKLQGMRELARQAGPDFVPPVRAPMGQLTLRIDSEIERWLMERQAAEQAKRPAVRFTLSDAVRDILWHAMQADKKASSTASPGGR